MSMFAKRIEEMNRRGDRSAIALSKAGSPCRGDRSRLAEATVPGRPPHPVPLPLRGREGVRRTGGEAPGRLGEPSLPRSALRAWLAGIALLGVCGAQAAALPQENHQTLAPFAQLPLCFEANRGQADARFQFLAHGCGCSFFLAPTEAAIMLKKVERPPVSGWPAPRAQAGHGGRMGRNERADVRAHLIRFEFVGANSQAQLSGLEALPGRVNYLLGNDPAQWRTDIPTFNKVRVREIYPGVDLVYYGNHQQLEYDFVIAPGVDASAITLRIEGADRVRIGARGELVLEVVGEIVRQHKPVAYQFDGGARRSVAAAYRLQAGSTVGFALSAYDRSLPLVIDPVLSYSTYLGGGSQDTAWDLAVDGSGNVYVAGETLSIGLPATTNAFQTNYAGGTSVGGDAFVAKLNTNGSRLEYLTYLGGSGEDGALSIAVDAAGNAFLTGYTDSTNFPTRFALPNQSAIHGSRDPGSGLHPLDAFVARLNANGSMLLYSTYLGGNAVDEGIGVALDADGNAHVTGFTSSTNFPTTNALQAQLAGGSDVFITKISAGGANFVYSTFLGGTNTDHGEGIAVDPAGYAYVTGYTGSTNFPTTTNAFRQRLNGQTNASTAFDAFVAKLAPTNGALVYSTLLGGNQEDIGFRIAVDSTGSAYVTGSTRSTNFPVTLSSLPTGVASNNFAPDAFLAKLDPGGTDLVYSTLFGGSASDEGWDLAVDASGNAYVVGVSSSTNFPTAQAASLQATNAGGRDVFVTAFAADGAALLYSTYLGGRLDDFGYGIDVDAAGNAYIVGQSFSTNFPAAGPLQPAFAGGAGDAFIAKILLEPTLSVAQSGTNVVVAWRAVPAEFLLESTASLAAPAIWTAVLQSPVVSNGWHTVTLSVTNGSSFFRLRRP